MGFNLRILFCQYINIWSDFHMDNPGMGPIHFVRKLLLFYSFIIHVDVCMYKMDVNKIKVAWPLTLNTYSIWVVVL